ncbi:hypothetical protein [Curtobacterium sp. ISL-83]|uniref:hypothetical protein n=1 Tax=Curtobacterium sp. ISL-83 TaxID=2819145 RepID=UPI001BEAC404|nr:hypothetical protein [Curtobacterium sp. ISL-83]MBT2504084.1 hypothetical protein [Curtobacterium sp. ISL-83]
MPEQGIDTRLAECPGSSRHTLPPPQHRTSARHLSVLELQPSAGECVPFRGNVVHEVPVGVHQALVVIGGGRHKFPVGREQERLVQLLLHVVDTNIDDGRAGVDPLHDVVVVRRDFALNEPRHL